MSVTATSTHLVTLATDSSEESGFRWTNLVIVLAIAALVFVVFKWVRPKLREQRRRAWKEAGLLPEQLDPKTDARSEPSKDDL